MHPNVRPKARIIIMLTGITYLADNYRKYLKRAEGIIHEHIIKTQAEQLTSILNE